jgi:putative glutamine amidotransferase
MNSGRPAIGITVDLEGEYFRVKHHYAHAILRCGGLPLLLPLEGDPKAYMKKIDGLLISGGADLDPAYFQEERPSQARLVARERSDFEISLLKEMVGLFKPVLGVCYGMQLMNVAFGGSLYQDIEAQLHGTIDHRTGHHPVAIRENRFMGKGTFSVNSTHHQAINRVGKGLSVIAKSPDNIAEAFCREDYPFLVGVQWHPERRLEEELSMGLFCSFIDAARVS